MKPEDYVRRQETLHGWPVNCVSYRLGDRYYCTVDNVDPGARLARGEGASREEAEREALDKAARYLAQTRKVSLGSGRSE